MKIFTLTLTLIILSGSIYAHQPKLINYSPSKSVPHQVVYPEISKAYYSKLTGEAHYYKINSKKEFLFYAGILSPKINDTYKWLSIDVIDENNSAVGKSYSTSVFGVRKRTFGARGQLNCFNCFGPSC